jgi:hypothetical protein
LNGLRRELIIHPRVCAEFVRIGHPNGLTLLSMPGRPIPPALRRLAVILLFVLKVPSSALAVDLAETVVGISVCNGPTRGSLVIPGKTGGIALRRLLGSNMVTAGIDFIS